MNRKQRRAAERKRKKGDAEQLMADKVHMFGQLPEKCDACKKTFDKQDRERRKGSQKREGQKKP